MSVCSTTHHLSSPQLFWNYHILHLKVLSRLFMGDRSSFILPDGPVYYSLCVIKGWKLELVLTPSLTVVRSEDVVETLTLTSWTITMISLLILFLKCQPVVRGEISSDRQRFIKGKCEMQTERWLVTKILMWEYLYVSVISKLQQ